MNSIKLLAALFLASSVSALKFLDIERGLEKEGLHRKLITTVTFRVQNPKEFSKDGPSLVFRETVGKETYIYMEELQKLKDFDFFPH